MVGYDNVAVLVRALGHQFIDDVHTYMCMCCHILCAVIPIDHAITRKIEVGHLMQGKIGVFLSGLD